MKNLLYIFCLLVLIASCKKDKMENNPKTITGKIAQDCGMTPLANTPMKLFVSESQSFTGSEVSIYDFTSDANGNFSYTLQNPPATFTSDLRFNGVIIGGVVPHNSDSKNLGTIIASPTANFVVKLKANNHYGVGDTLYFPNFQINEIVKIAAPVSDSIFNVVYNYSSIQNRTLSNKNKIEISSFYAVWGGAPYKQIKEEYFTKYITACTGILDTVLIEIN